MGAGEYADRALVLGDEIGRLEWAAPQDWMCEPFVVARTGKSVDEHQALTVGNFCDLRARQTRVRFVPVLQGYTVDDYLACVRRYELAGVDLGREAVVGLGSVCRRQGTDEAGRIIDAVRAAVPGVRLHGFGFKRQGLARFGGRLHSSDSLAWSFRARNAGRQAGCAHATCANCAVFAMRWRARTLEMIGDRDHEISSARE